MVNVPVGPLSFRSRFIRICYDIPQGTSSPTKARILGRLRIIWAIAICNRPLDTLRLRQTDLRGAGRTKPASPCFLAEEPRGHIVPHGSFAGTTVKSLVSKRSIVIAGHKTSVSLEDEFWDSLKEIAVERGMTLGALVAAIDGNRQNANLSSAIRLFVLGVYRDQRR
jgi:predicted DNA-binding ribbon-helix-helix protein